MSNRPHTTINISNSTIIRVILFALLIYTLYLLSDVVLIVLTSIVLASFVDAASRRMMKVIPNRSLSVVIIFVLTLSCVAALFYLFVPILIQQAAVVVGLLAKYLPHADFLNTLQSGVFSNAKDLSTLSSDSVTGVVSRLGIIAQGVSQGFLGTVSGVFGGVLNFVLIVVISFYLSIQEKGIEKFLRIITPERTEAYAIGLWQRSQRKIALWIKGQLLLGVLIGVLVFLGLSIFNVPNALVLAFTAAIFELIPFGLVLAVIPAISFAYLSGGISKAILVGGFYLIIQQFENYLIAPLVIKRVIGISPLVVILSILIGAKLAGFWGLILAIPVAVALMEFADDVEKKKPAVSFTE